MKDRFDPYYEKSLFEYRKIVNKIKRKAVTKYGSIALTWFGKE